MYLWTSPSALLWSREARLEAVPFRVSQIGRIFAVSHEAERRSPSHPLHYLSDSFYKGNSRKLGFRCLGFSETQKHMSGNTPAINIRSIVLKKRRSVVPQPFAIVRCREREREREG